MLRHPELGSPRIDISAVPQASEQAFAKHRSNISNSRFDFKKKNLDKLKENKKKKT